MDIFATCSLVAVEFAVDVKVVSIPAVGRAGGCGGSFNPFCTPLLVSALLTVVGPVVDMLSNG